MVGVDDDATGADKFPDADRDPAQAYELGRHDERIAQAIGKLGELTVTFHESVPEHGGRDARRLFTLTMKDEVQTEWPFVIVADADAEAPRRGQRVRAVFYTVEDP